MERLEAAIRRVRQRCRKHRHPVQASKPPLESDIALAERLAKELREGSYRPKPQVKEIPKAGGGVRSLKAPSFEDKVVQVALLEVIEPLIDLPDSLHGFRKGRGVKTAIRAVADLVDQDLFWAVCVDIRACFDSVNLERLFRRLKKRISDPRVLTLIRQIVLSGRRDARQGIPQGAPISPFLLNVYLSDLDKRLVTSRHPGRWVIYADDLIILCPNLHRARTAIGLVKSALADLGLEPSEKRPLKPVNLHHQKVEFLGLTVDRPYKKGMGTRKCRVRASAKARQRLEELKAAGSAASITGWQRYYETVTCQP